MHIAHRIILFLVIILACSVNPARAQDEKAKPAKLFAEDTRLEVTITGPWRQMMRRVTNPQTYPAELSFTDSNGQHSLAIGVTTRGLTRRDKVCDFPPLKLWFDKELAKETTFRGQSSLKMVTHCKAPRGYEQFYIKEYLSYRIYNLITPFSFRVRPLMVTYLDSENKKAKPLVRFGFLIEDVDDVAKRNDQQQLEVKDVSHRLLDTDETSNYMLFQYLISNLDWSVTGGPKEECCHNSKLIGQDANTAPVYALPYDLDSSGLVDTPYSAPPRQLSVTTTKQRLYRGFCAHNEGIAPALERFRQQRSQITGLFENDDQLTPAARKTAVEFLESFYRKLDSPQAVDNLLKSRCRR